MQKEKRLEQTHRKCNNKLKTVVTAKHYIEQWPAGKASSHAASLEKKFTGYSSSGQAYSNVLVSKYKGWSVPGLKLKVESWRL